MAKKHIFRCGTFNLEAYKSRGTISRSLIIHLVITDKNGSTFEHMITKEELREGYKQLKILYQFSHLLTDIDIVEIEHRLLEFIKSDTPEEVRYEGYTTKQIRNHILSRLEPNQVVGEDDESVDVIATELRKIVDNNQYLYGNITEEIIIQLILDLYIEFKTEDNLKHYKVMKGNTCTEKN